MRMVVSDVRYLYNTFQVNGISNRWDVYSDTKGTKGLSWKHINGEYDVCMYNNSILLTNFYELPSFLNKVYTDITFTSRKCSEVQKTPADCGETIGVAVYVTNRRSMVAIAEQVKKRNRDYVQLPTVNLSTDFAKWTEMLEISHLSGKKYIRYLINSRNACGRLNNFTVYYYTFPVFSRLTSFKETIAPSNKNETTEVVGQCVENSKPLNGKRPFINCAWNGTATIVGSCVCKKGFTNKSSQCIGKFLYKNITIKYVYNNTATVKVCIQI